MTTRLRPLPWALGGLTVALQIPYPLVHGTARQDLTIASVITFALATLIHLAVTRGVGGALRLLVGAGVLSFGIEALGVHTGYPFGTYAYGDRLGPKLADVPLLVPLAWTMMSWPALAAARRICADLRFPARLCPVRLGIPLLTAVGLAGWDLFLDPQMVRDGHWTWSFAAGAPALQGIPLTNLVGWLLAGFVVAFVIDRLLPARTTNRPTELALPLALFLWTYAGSVIMNAVFLSRPGIAISGGIGMGLVAVPLIWFLAAKRVDPKPTVPGNRSHSMATR
jgi:putative membrane protein